jgi:hypothetical protein
MSIIKWPVFFSSCSSECRQLTRPVKGRSSHEKESAAIGNHHSLDDFSSPKNPGCEYLTSIHIGMRYFKKI